MKLLPAAIFVIVLFLAGSLFLAGRRSSKMALFIPLAALFLLLGILFKLIGKIALLIAVIAIAIFFMSSRRR